MAIEDIIRAAAAQHGVNPDDLVRIGQIESNLDPNAANSRSTAKGLFQFVDRTRAQYGNFDPFNAEANADAGARLASDNARALRNGLGRDPTGGELYLAHQQGSGGALKLLLNPDADAASLVGARSVMLNGGRAGMKANDFANLWVNKFGSAPPSAPSPFLASSSPPASGQAPALPKSDGLSGMLAGGVTEEPPKKAAKPAPQQRGLDLGSLFASLSPELTRRSVS
jgi:hypothetical protein